MGNVLSPESSRHTEYHTSLLVVGEARCNKLSFTLEGVSVHSCTTGFTRNFTDVEGPWILAGFISYPLMFICAVKKSKVVDTSCLLGPISICHQHFGQCDILWKKTGDRLPLNEVMIQGWKANKLWGKTAKLYCWSGQLEVNCLW